MENSQAAWRRLFPWILVSILRDRHFHDTTLLCGHLYPGLVLPATHSNSAQTAIAICEKIDPYGYYAPYKLFRESCRSRGVMQPQLLKDLDYLGRDLSKTVFIDTKPELFALQPDNGFGVPPWKGDRRDTGLVDLIPLLEAIAFNRVQDVRDVVRAYKGRDPVKAYAESEARQKKELLDKWEQDKQAHTGPRFNFGSLFGIGAVRRPLEQLYFQG